MEETPRQRLGELWAKYGHSLLDEPSRCAGLLRDTCYGQYRLEITVLVHALQDGVATALLTAAEGIPIEVVLARLTQRLQDHQGLSAEAARWAVESWALAVGKLAPEALVPSPDPLKDMARHPPQEQQARQAVAEQARQAAAHIRRQEPPKKSDGALLGLLSVALIAFAILVTGGDVFSRFFGAQTAEQMLQARTWEYIWSVKGGIASLAFIGGLWGLRQSFLGH